MTDRIVITAVHCMTPVGLDAATMAIAVRAGISALRLSDQFDDTQGEPILEACLPWLPEGESDEDGVEEDEADAEEEVDPDQPDEEDDPEVAAALAAANREAEAEEADEERDHIYELARQTDEVARLQSAARHSLDALLDDRFGHEDADGRAVTLLLAAATPTRPGPRFEGEADDLLAELGGLIRRRGGRTDVDVVRTGHAGALHALSRAVSGLARNPSALYVLGAVDSLLALDTLNWLEDSERLKSGTFGRHQGLSPAEAVAFLVVETERSARRAGRPVLATVGSVTLTQEPNPFASDTPSRADGLTAACATALQESGVGGRDIGVVLSDQDGEFHRARDWALAEIRCLGETGERVLMHPADCFGNVGAASAAVLLVLAAVGLSRGWFVGPVLVVSSDETGECGAAVLFPFHD